MSTATSTDTSVSSLQEKARELCQFILESPDYAAAQGKVDIFDEDTEAQKLYQAWRETEMELHQQHQQGNPPTDEQITDLEMKRDAAVENSVVADFADAENTLNQIFSTVVKVVQKSLQSGTIPTDEELNECCNSGG